MALASKPWMPCRWPRIVAQSAWRSSMCRRNSPARHASSERGVTREPLSDTAVILADRGRSCKRPCDFFCPARRCRICSRQRIGQIHRSRGMLVSRRSLLALAVLVLAAARPAGAQELPSPRVLPEPAAAQAATARGRLLRRSRMPQRAGRRRARPRVRAGPGVAMSTIRTSASRTAMPRLTMCSSIRCAPDRAHAASRCAAAARDGRALPALPRASRLRHSPGAAA